MSCTNRCTVLRSGEFHFSHHVCDAVFNSQIAESAHLHTGIYDFARRRNYVVDSDSSVCHILVFPGSFVNAERKIFHLFVELFIYIFVTETCFKFFVCFFIFFVHAFLSSSEREVSDQSPI